MKKSLHPEAMKAIKRKVKDSLVNCLIENNWPKYESFSTHIEALSKEVLKHKKEWIDELDVFSISYDFVYEAIKNKIEGEANINGALWEFLI